jgi:DNA-binding transcriptional MerR regulator/methylmalonyl-CoA mutase cobalamin-binding subunit
VAELYTIATISLETGISKEVLRKWEERYGFPVPQRDASGHRAYAAHQTARLKLIKRLIDSGMRPARVVALAEEELQSLVGGLNDDAPASHAGIVAELMTLLHARDRTALAARLKQEVARLGLENFVLEVMCVLNGAVGAAWERGEIGIRDEHVYTEVIQSLVREEISRVTRHDGLPRILVTTPSGELHTLGLLMVDALASSHGACCMSLGAQTPIDELAHAVADYHADVVCLCFSAAFPRRRIFAFLKELRDKLPKPVEIWIGGAGVTGLERSPRGVNVMLTLQELIDAVHKYRRARQPPPARKPPAGGMR